VPTVFPEVSTTLAAAQLIGIVLFGFLTVTRFPIWSPVDEGAHFTYLQTVAEKKRLPILKKDLVSPQVRSILQGRYPLEAEPLPAVLALGDYSYEAFQPPLYYMAAVPAFSLSDNYRTKVVLVRFFDLALLLTGILLLALLCRSVFPEGPMPPFAIGLSAFLVPGVLVRAITVSNSALEIPLVLLLMLPSLAFAYAPRHWGSICCGFRSRALPAHKTDPRLPGAYLLTCPG
jgi:hypothetical protein